MITYYAPWVRATSLVELAAVHHELAVDSLLCFADFAMDKHWRSTDAVHLQLQGLIEIWCICGTDDQLNLGWHGSYKGAREKDPRLY